MVEQYHGARYHPKATTLPDAKGHRTFIVPTSTEPLDVKISEPDLRADNLSLETWAASHILASQLHRLKNIDTHSKADAIPILEIGAGTGLVGVTAAAIWSSKVILTDMAPIVPGLATNIDINQSLLDSHGGSGDAGTLDWTEPTALTLHSGERLDSGLKANVILAADVVYDEEHPPMLAAVIAEWLAKTKEARLIFCWPLRVAYLDEIRDMWQRLEGIGLESIEEGQERAQQGEFDDEALCEWSVWRWKDL